MSFTRRVKYGNIMAARKLKKKVTSKRVETFGFIVVAAITMAIMNMALLSI